MGAAVGAISVAVWGSMHLEDILLYSAVCKYTLRQLISSETHYYWRFLLHHFRMFVSEFCHCLAFSAPLLLPSVTRAASTRSPPHSSGWSSMRWADYYGVQGMW